ncbi:DUF6285 domain-containing protein [Actinomadura scrupuli]|uniref:DUF6285 domain-containing protein n=1 Tax=Actinomadura scrupuli TaxID=559629 RepID=UPI003D994A11
MAPPHDAPDAAELVAAVREFLRDEVLPTAQDRVRFHCLVAISALAMVEREMELGPAQAAAHRERLAALGFDGDAELAAAIRTGLLDDRRPEVETALLDAVRAKLAVANPAYLE